MKFSQNAKWLLIIMGASVVVFLSVLLFTPVFGEAPWVILLVPGIMLFTGLIFYRLTIRINEEKIKAAFGVGLLSFSWKMQDIEDVRPVRNSWWMGLGIRLLPRMTIYNVSGLDAVELTFKNSSRKVRLGTDQPHKLAEAIKKMRP